MRTAQDFDARNVIEIRVDDDLAGLRQRRRRQRHLVEIEADRGGGAAVGSEAARLVFRLGRARRTHGQARHFASHRLNRGDARCVELLAAQRRQADRRILDRRIVFFGGDRDLFQAGLHRRIGSGSGSGKRPGRRKARSAEEGRDDERREEGKQVELALAHLIWSSPYLVFGCTYNKRATHVAGCQRVPLRHLTAKSYTADTARFFEEPCDGTAVS